MMAGCLAQRRPRRHAPYLTTEQQEAAATHFDLDLDLDLDLELDDARAMNFRKLEVYQTAVRLLPLAAQIADALPQRHASLADQLRSITLDPAEHRRGLGQDHRA